MSVDTASIEVVPLNQQHVDNEDISSNIRKAPGSGWAWVVLACSFFIHVLMDGFAFTYGVIAAELTEDESFGISRQWNGWTSSTLTCIKLGGAPLVGLACRRFGDRPMTIAGACLAAAGLAASYFAARPWTLLVSVGLVTGIGTSLMYLPSMVIVGLYFDNKHRSTAMGIAFGGSGLGMLAFGPLVDRLIDVYSWRGALLILSGMMLNCAVFGSLMRPLPKTAKKVTATISAEARTSATHLSKLKSLYRDREFLLLLLSHLVFNFGFDTPFLYAPDRARRAGHSTLLSALLVSIMGAANVAGRFSVGLLSDRLTTCRFDKTALQVGTMLGAGVAAVCGVLSESYGVQVAHGTAYGLFIGAYVSISPAVCAHLLGPDSLSYSYGVTLLCQSVGVLLGPPLAGAIFDATGSFRVSYLTASGFMIAGSLVAIPLPWLVKRRRGAAAGHEQTVELQYGEQLVTAPGHMTAN